MICFIVVTILQAGEPQSLYTNAYKVNYLRAHEQGSYLYYDNKEVVSIVETVPQFLKLIKANCKGIDAHESLFTQAEEMAQNVLDGN
jgi:hypothetical protein